MRTFQVVLVVALVASGVFWYRSYAAREKQPRFETRPASQGDVEQDVVTTGTVQPIHTISVGCQVSGIVQKMFVDFNSPVHKGQIIARIDPSTFETQREQAQAQLDSAIAGVNNAIANLDNTMANLKSAQASVATAQAAVASAQVGIASAQANRGSARAAIHKAEATAAVNKLTYDRDVPLRKRDLIPQSQVDTDRTAWLTAQADVENARAGLGVAQAAIDSARVTLTSARTGVEAARQKEEAARFSVAAGRASVASAQQAVKQQQANLKLASVNLGYCVIRSPVDGVVIARNLDPGQTVAASLTTPQLYSLATDLHKMQVLANLDESDMAQVYNGQKATFTVDAYPNETFQGVVSQVRDNSTIVNNVVTYQVVISVDNPRLKLLPSMTANLSLLVQARHDVLLVPSMALRFHPDEADYQPTSTSTPGASGSPEEHPHPHHHHPWDGPGGGEGHHRTQVHQGRVWVLVETRPQPIDVKTGITDGTNTEIVGGGVQPGQAVIVTEVGPSGSPSRGPMPRRMF
jgi:HlyD family secretion protein